MLKVNYTEEAKEKISQFRYHYPDPRIQKHFEMIWLHACGIKVPEIAMLTGTNPYTVRGIIKKYCDGGMEEVVKTKYHRLQSSLEHHYKTSIIEEFTKRPPTTSNEAAHRIKQLFGVERSS
jgi:hypothetical protein